ncbi:hypothetical protein ACE1TF_13875 [Geomicrobium sp. JSM 1781026]|uniref:hypothetical protein n=1 Tax=Geomicrobium sp. JSM 1781026 TaxID=3344580 RepID=UPI0035C232D0
MKMIPVFCFSVMMLPAMTACGDPEESNGSAEGGEEIDTDDLNEAEEVALEFVEYVEGVNRYRMEYEIEGTEAMHVIEYADLLEGFSRSETDGEEDGIVYSAMGDEYSITYHDHFNMYNDEELSGVEDNVTDLSLWATTLEANLSDEDATLTYEGEEEVDGVMTHRISSNYDDGESIYWFDQQSSMLVKYSLQRDLEQDVTIFDFEEIDEFEDGFFELEDMIPDDAEEGDITEAIAEEQGNE